MSAAIPAKARAVIIGGGVSGCSVAYHLAKLGWTDVVLLERKQLTCGTTWHAAGLIGQLRGSPNMTRLAKYSADLYVRLEAETGVATGMRQNGSITVALTRDAQEEIYRQATLARAFDVDVQRDLARRKSRRCIRISTCRTWSARCTCRSTASATRPTSPWRWPRARGSAARRSSRASRSRAVHQANGRVTGVDWAQGERAGHDRGRYRRQLRAACGRAISARMSGVTLPLHACEHFYIVTEPIAGLWPPAGAAGAGRVRLLQGRRRQDDARRLRAGGQALGHGRHSRGFLLRPAAGGFRPFRADPGDGGQPHADAGHGRHPHLLQRPGKLHARRPLLSRRSAGA